MNNLFNQKLLVKRLENFYIPEEKLKKASEIISNWTSRLISGELEKQNEKMLQGDFLRDFFQTILDYPSMTTTPDNYNFIQHPKTEVDKRREPDGSLGFFGNIRLTKAVLELKGPKEDLDKKQNRAENLSPVEQAFLYIFKYEGCNWAIVSNIKEIRLYSKERGQGFYHSFKLLDLKAETQKLKLFYFLLCKNNLITEKGSSLTFELLKETSEREEIISEKFYTDYKNVRKNLFKHITTNNPDLEKETAFLKTQKLLDRFIFACFCEDTRNLLPHQIIRKTYETGKGSRRRGNQKIWEEFQNLFMDIDLGRYDLDPKINKFNGGLFAKDDILDNLNILDDAWIEVVKLSDYDFETDLTVNILGHIFEQSISDLEQIKQSLDIPLPPFKGGKESNMSNISKRKKDGIFYTPSFITSFLVKNTAGVLLNENTDKLETMTILDPACGSGAFLNQAHDFLVKEYERRLAEQIEHKMLDKKKNVYQLDIISDQSKALAQNKQLLNNLYGVDLNEESVEITRLSLWLKTADRSEELANLDKNIMVGNSLIEDPEFTDKPFKWDELEIIKNGGFDIITGNPPYLNIQGLTDFHNNTVSYLSKNYLSATGNYDLYVVFLEKAFKLLKEGGRSGLIIPHKFINANFGSGIRNFLKENRCVEKIISFGHNLIFKDATTYTGLVFLRKTPLESLLYYEVKGNKTNQEIETEINKLTDDDFSTISYESLNDKKWIFSGKNNIAVLEKLNQQPLRVNNIFSKIFQGMISGRDAVFCLEGELKGNYLEGFSKELNKAVKLEKGILKPHLKGEDIHRYTKLKNREFCIFPYIINESKAELMTEKYIKENFPLAYIYFKECETVLRSRENNKMNHEKWYEYSRNQSLASFEQLKIITPEISFGSNMTFDNNNFYHNSKCHSYIKKPEIKEDYKYFLCLLNSSLMWFFLKNTGNVLRGGYFTFKKSYLEPFPIPQLDSLEQQNPFVEIANKLIETTNTFYTTKDNFLEWLTVNFKLEKHRNKFENIHKISKEEFYEKLRELKVDLSDIQLFGNLAKNHSILINNFNTLMSLEQEANEMVYKLYGLTEDEIKIIEEDIKV